jgi:hypothetical protein
MDDTNCTAREWIGERCGLVAKSSFRKAGRLCLLAAAMIGSTGTAFAQDSSDWTADVGIIALRKGDPDSTVLFVEPFTNTSLFDASAFSFDYEIGPDVTLTRSFGGGSLVKARVFGVDGWSDSKSFFAPFGANLNANPPVGGPPAPPPARQVHLDYDSELFSAEINCGTAVSNGLTFLAGFRYLQINEELDALRTNPFLPGNISSIVVETRNALYGLQVGGEANLRSTDLWRVDAFLKVGVFANDAQNSLDYFQTAGADWVNKDDTTHVSWMGETGISAALQFTPSISLKAGYQILWLTDIAEAGEQVPRFNIVPLPAVGNGIDVNGTTFYHGANAQLVFVW